MIAATASNRLVQFSRWRRCAFVLLLVLLIAFAIAELRRRMGDPLARIHPTHRIVEGRISLFDHAELSVARSDVTRPAAIDAEDFYDLKERLVEDRSADNVQRFALAVLASGKKEEAYELLREAVLLRPDDDTIAADLVATEIALGHFADAAERAAKILESDAGNQRAQFNWALALEGLSIRHAAIKAWKGYLAMDSSSGWADEARLHLDRLNRKPVVWETERLSLRPGVDRPTIRRLIARFPQRVRMRAQNVLLPAWAENGREGELAVLFAIAEERAATDPYLLDIVRHASGNRTAVAPGLRAFTAARAAEGANDMRSGAVFYAQAADLLGSVGSPLAIGAAIYAASNETHGGDSEAALSRIEDVDQRLVESGRRYTAMAAEAEWVRGMALMRLGESQRSLEAFQRALGHAGRAGEAENEAFIASMIATELELVGDPVEAERYRLQSLRMLDALQSDVHRMYVALFESGFTSLRIGRPRVALAFLDASVALGSQQNNQLYVSESLAQRAFGLWQIGRITEAKIAISAARAGALQISDMALRDRTLSDIDYINGHIEQRDNPSAAMRAFSSALDTAKKYKWRLHIAAAYLAYGEAALEAGDRRQAQSAFRAGIEEMERQRADLNEPGIRIAYFERADRIFSRLIELLIDAGRISDALSIAERKRARALLDQTDGSSGVATPLISNEIVARVPDGVTLLELTVLERGVALWLAGNSRLVHGRSEAPRAAILQSVQRHMAAIAAHDVAAVRREGRWLFDQLIGPVARYIPAGSILGIVPDDMLQAFPFATLTTPDGKFMIEEFPLLMAPSASILLRTDGGRRGSGESLVVAQPAPPGYDRLPGAAAEAAAVARLHDRGRLRVGTEIDPQKFLAAARDASLVHFAGHSRNHREPRSSALLFDSSGDSPAALTAEAISRSGLRAQPVVVLAACSTGQGQLRRNEGIDSLAAAFLRAGARSVVATLWNIEDNASGRLFRALHQNMRRGARPADALRDAQLSLLYGDTASDRSPREWGSAILIGTLR